MARLSIREAAAIFEDYRLTHPVPGTPENLYQPARYALETGGKRLRPLLLLLSCDACSGDPLKARPAALAIELFHNFTLVHDDIMDQAPVRRGQLSIWGKWGTNSAVLSGDAMMILAYEALAGIGEQQHFKKLFTVFNSNAIKVCEGQQLDIDFEAMTVVTEEAYLDMIGKKTACLIACAMEMGALCAGADESVSMAYRDAGHLVGLAFQIQDDWLDLYGNTVFGKKTGGDIIKHKKTYLWVKAAAKGKDVHDQLISCQKIVDPDVAIEAHRKLYDTLAIDEDCRKDISGYMTKAGEILHQIKTADNSVLWPFIMKLVQREN